MQTVRQGRELGLVVRFVVLEFGWVFERSHFEGWVYYLAMIQM